MKVVDVNSPVMKKLNDGLVKDAGVRVLYAYYFGTRQLTANKAVMQPSDLAGQKIRAIPFPIYMTTVEGLGAVPVAGRLVGGADRAGHRQGRRARRTRSTWCCRRKLYETQSHMMLTGAHHERAGHRHQREGLAEA